MNEQDFNASDSSDNDADRGSAWARLDEQFFAIVDALFSVGFCSLADSMLGTHDNEMSDEQRAVRRAAMGRHPSAWRRF